MARTKREGDHSHITYISTFKYSLGGENKQKLPFSNPPFPLQLSNSAASGYIVYKWSLSNAFGATDMVDVEDLYCEVIYCLLHMIGNDSPKVS